MSHLSQHFSLLFVVGFAVTLLLLVLNAVPTAAHDDAVHATSQRNAPPAGATSTGTVQSQPGDNLWNQGTPSEDWWEDIRRQHGHVGPWNILGWRIGQAAMRELEARWGDHQLEIICHVPPQTPFTCMIDGLAVGTGNSAGRLDLRCAEVLHYHQSSVSVRRKDKTGPVLIFIPRTTYLDHITNQPGDQIETLSRTCVEMEEAELFSIERLNPGDR